MIINLAKIDFSGVKKKFQDKRSEMNIIYNDPLVIKPDYGYDGMKSVEITHKPVQKNKRYRATTYGEHLIYPIENYGGMAQCEVNVNVPINKGDVTLNVDQNNHTYTINASDYGLDGMSKLFISVYLPDNNTYLRVPPQWNGSVDVEGLKTLGWNDEQIADLQKRVTWMSVDNEDYKVTENDKSTPAPTDDTSYMNNKTITWTKPVNIKTGLKYFASCENLKGIPAITMENTETASRSNMFYHCYELESVPYFEGCGPINAMFSGCWKLKTVPKLNLTAPHATGSPVTYAQSVFYNCYSLISVPDLNLTGITNFQTTFLNCRSLESVPSLDFTQCINAHRMFEGCSRLKKGQYMDMAPNIPTKLTNTYKRCSSLEYVPFIRVNKSQDFESTANMSGLFSGCVNLTTIDALYCWNTVDFSETFSECYNLRNITIPDSISVNVSFHDCYNLTYNSVKSILTACSNSRNTGEKIIEFNLSMTDNENELQNLVQQCVNKGWMITGLHLK